MGRHFVAKGLAVLVLVIVLTSGSDADTRGKRSPHMQDKGPKRDERRGGPEPRPPPPPVGPPPRPPGPPPPPPGPPPKGDCLNDAMNVGNWKCALRTIDGVTSKCVITGSPTAPTTPPQTIVTGCNWYLPTFCDYSVAKNLAPPPPPTTTTTPALPTLPAGYAWTTGVAAYKVYPGPSTWAAAKSTCEAEGAHLAVPSTAADYAALAAVINAATPAITGAYIGFSDSAAENNFVAVTGQPICMMAQEVWAASEPNNGLVATVQGPVENCVKFNSQSPPSMSDVPCTDTMPFVCQISLPSRLTMCRTRL